MLRLFVYFASFLKLLMLGRWYPPAHVRDVPAQDFLDLKEAMIEFSERLGAAERQTESTRKKVYRDDGKEAAVNEVEAVMKPKIPMPSPANPLSGLEAGDQVPEGLL